MNRWVQKSIELANSKGYFDDLLGVYPVDVGINRKISKESIEKVKNAFKNKNKTLLVKTLLELPKFPIDDPYIASLRKYSLLFDKNPKTVKRIGERLFSIKLDTLLKLANQPKSPSRQLGQSFRKWLRTIKYPFLVEEKFKNYKKISFLEGSDEKLKQFAIKELGIKRLKRRPDFLLKVKDKFIIGEAKFLTDHGGTQNNQFDEAVKITKIKNDKAIGIAVLDGILWFDSRAHMHNTVKKINGIALSALLLKDLIKSF
jgi:hypothetical protein